MTQLHHRTKGLLAAVGVVLGSNAVAQTTLESVVVTVQKREESLQAVGISVAAVSGTQLEQLGVSRATDIVQQVPTLQPRR